MAAANRLLPLADSHLRLLPLGHSSSAPQLCSSLSATCLPFPLELPARQHPDWAVPMNYLKGACWHFTSNHFSSTAAAVVECFVAMATQPEE